MLRVAMHQPNFLPYPGFFEKIAKADLFIVVDHLTFSKGRDNWHHRNRIRTNNNGIGWEYITVPVSEHWNWKPFHEARISDVFSFRKRKHLKTIEQSYGRSPFFGKHYEDFREVYREDEPSLCEFNIRLIMWLLERFSIRTEVLRSTELDFNNGLRKTDMIIELMNRVNGDHFISGDGAREYLEPEKFDRAGLSFEFQNYEQTPYMQQFPEFVPNLSAFDILMNCGSIEPNGYSQKTPEAMVEKELKEVALQLSA